MTAPRRIQLRRTKGWRKPPGSIVVSRPSKWGNPFRIERASSRRDGPLDMWAVTLEGRWLVRFDDKRDAATDAVDRYRGSVLTEAMWPRVPWPHAIRVHLAGHDLACWCPPDQPCHADVLLELANAEAN
jgi:hypothetical protein